MIHNFVLGTCIRHNFVKIGDNSSFWFNRWVGNQAISEAYSKLYAKVVAMFMFVVDASFWDGVDWMLDSGCWLREEDDDDREMLILLLDDLPQLSIENLGIDISFWATEEDKGFSVKGCPLNLGE